MFPHFSAVEFFWLDLRFCASLILTMIHLRFFARTGRLCVCVCVYVCVFVLLGVFVRACRPTMFRKEAIQYIN